MKYLSLLVLCSVGAWGQVISDDPNRTVIESEEIDLCFPDVPCPIKGEFDIGDGTPPQWVEPLYIHLAPKPDPIDVPAIKGECAHTRQWCDPDTVDSKGVVVHEGTWCHVECDEFRWSCKNKSRIKLTAEDGKVWCHAPQP